MHGDADRPSPGTPTPRAAPAHRSTPSERMLLDQGTRLVGSAASSRWATSRSKSAHLVCDKVGHRPAAASTGHPWRSDEEMSRLFRPPRGPAPRAVASTRSHARPATAGRSRGGVFLVSTAVRGDRRHKTLTYPREWARARRLDERRYAAARLLRAALRPDSTSWWAAGRRGETTVIRALMTIPRRRAVRPIKRAAVAARARMLRPRRG